MSKDLKSVCISIGVIVFALLLNMLILKTAYAENQNRCWMLIASMSILLIMIYNVWQINHLFQKNFIDNLPSDRPQKQFEELSHSIYANNITTNDLKVKVGNGQCSQPYNACIFNIESIKNTKTEGRINWGNELNLEYPGYLVNGGLNTYPLAAGGFAWQIDSCYTGCRTENGHFNSKAFEQIARRPEMKMIELKLSCALKPIHRGNSSLNIQHLKDEKIDNSIFPGSAYTTFREAEGMIYFINSLRDLSGGKPIGIRLCIQDKKEFYQICYAIRKTQIIPDFIVVEGLFECTDNYHIDQAFHVGIPLYEALVFVSQTLQAYSIEKEIKIIASGRITSCLDILKVLALGANVVCTEMPDYSTNDRPISTLYKGKNISNFHNNLMRSLVRSMNVCGFTNLADITLSKFVSRVDILYSKGVENFKSPVLWQGTVKKIYNSQIKSYQIQERRKKVNIV